MRHHTLDASGKQGQGPRWMTADKQHSQHWTFEHQRPSELCKESIESRPSNAPSKFQVVDQSVPALTRVRATLPAHVELVSTNFIEQSAVGVGVPVRVAPLSLTSALGLSGDESPTPSVPSSKLVTPTSTPLGVAGGVDEHEDLDAFIFAFTIRVAEGSEFGLVTSAPQEKAGEKVSSYLRIDAISAGGALEAWNRQCGSSGAPEKVLLPGDRITSVNGVDGAEAMRREFSTSRLLRMLVVRTPPRSSSFTAR